MAKHIVKVTEYTISTLDGSYTTKTVKADLTPGKAQRLADKLNEEGYKDPEPGQAFVKSYRVEQASP